MKKAEIISAYKLSNDELNEIIKKFKFLKDYQIENFIDSNIIGGFLIKYEGKILDFSLLSQLKNFKKILYEID